MRVPRHFFPAFSAEERVPPARLDIALMSSKVTFSILCFINSNKIRISLIGSEPSDLHFLEIRIEFIFGESVLETEFSKQCLGVHLLLRFSRQLLATSFAAFAAPPDISRPVPAWALSRETIRPSRAHAIFRGPSRKPQRGLASAVALWLSSRPERRCGHRGGRSNLDIITWRTRNLETNAP